MNINARNHVYVVYGSSQEFKVKFWAIMDQSVLSPLLSIIVLEHSHVCYALELPGRIYMQIIFILTELLKEWRLLK